VRRTQVRVPGRGRRPATVKLVGTDRALRDILNITMHSGRFWSAHHEKTSRRVCVLGKAAARRVFGNANAAGRFLELYGHLFEVAGVIGACDRSPFLDAENAVFLPHDVSVRAAGKADVSDFLLLSHRDAADSDALERRIRAFFAEIPGGENVTLWNQNEFIRKKKQMIRMTALLVNSIPFLILFVACISCSNILVISVRERTHEIGLRIALGATRSDILFQFIHESLLLFAVAGILGGGIGYVLTEWFLKPLPGIIPGYRGFTFAFSNESLFRALGILFVSALLSSLLPAARAANLDPGTALRE
jgi:putative ABC transport system permease protein